MRFAWLIDESEVFGRSRRLCRPALEDAPRDSDGAASRTNGSTLNAQSRAWQRSFGQFTLHSSCTAAVQRCELAQISQFVVGSVAHIACPRLPMAASGRKRTAARLQLCRQGPLAAAAEGGKNDCFAAVAVARYRPRSSRNPTESGHCQAMLICCGPLLRRPTTLRRCRLSMPTISGRSTNIVWTSLSGRTRQDSQRRWRSGAAS